MGLLDRILGRVPSEQQRQTPTSSGVGWSSSTQGPLEPAGSSTAPRPAAGEEDRAVARYRYLLRTAPPEQLEALHAEAFARLTPDQRRQLLTELARSAPAGEQPTSAEPADLARAATRAEMRQPGVLQNTFSRGAFAGGAGGMFMGSMMGTVAGVVVGSVIADSLLDGFGASPEGQEMAAADGADASGGDGGAVDDGSGGDGAVDAGYDAGGYDAGGGDVGGGGDFGGAGFGGGDFGGGDFGGF